MEEYEKYQILNGYQLHYEIDSVNGVVKLFDIREKIDEILFLSTNQLIIYLQEKYG